MVTLLLAVASIAMAASMGSSPSSPALAGSTLAHSTGAAAGVIAEVEAIAAKAGAAPGAVNEVHSLSQAPIDSLARLGVDAVPEIGKALRGSGKDWKAKAMLCESLGRISDPKASQVLTEVLLDSGQHEFVRAVAGHALASMDRTEAAETIKSVVSNPGIPIQIRSRTMMAVGQTGHGNVAWLETLARGGDLGLPADPHAQISQDEFGLILNAQRALGKSRNAKATDALISLLREHPTNAVVVEALGARKDPRAIPALIGALTHKHDKVSTSRESAAEILGQMRAQEAVQPLMTILETFTGGLSILRDIETAKAQAKSRIERLRAFAVSLSTMPRSALDDTIARSEEHKALKESQAELERLRKLLDGEADDVILAWKAAEALGNIGNSRAITLLQQLLRDPRMTPRVALGGGNVRYRTDIETALAKLEVR